MRLPSSIFEHSVTMFSKLAFPLNIILIEIVSCLFVWCFKDLHVPRIYERISTRNTVKILIAVPKKQDSRRATTQVDAAIDEYLCDPSAPDLMLVWRGLGLQTMEVYRRHRHDGYVYITGGFLRVTFCFTVFAVLCGFVFKVYDYFQPSALQVVTGVLGLIGSNIIVKNFEYFSERNLRASREVSEMLLLLELSKIIEKKDTVGDDLSSEAFRQLERLSQNASTPSIAQAAKHLSDGVTLALPDE